MTKEELYKAKLLVYMTDGNVDEYKADEWTRYNVEENNLIIKQALGSDYFTRAIYNMYHVEKVVLSL